MCAFDDSPLLHSTVADSFTGEKFTIDNVRFQDPSFTDADREFLEKRGHTVVDWNTDIPKVGGGYSMDPSLLKFITSSTMCYLPFLDDTTIVEVICSVKPSLYLGLNLVASSIKEFLVSQLPFPE